MTRKKKERDDRCWMRVTTGEGKQGVFRPKTLADLEPVETLVLEMKLNPSGSVSTLGQDPNVQWRLSRESYLDKDRLYLWGFETGYASEPWWTRRILRVVRGRIIEPMQRTYRPSKGDYAWFEYGPKLSAHLDNLSGRILSTQEKQAEKQRRGKKRSAYVTAAEKARKKVFEAFKKAQTEEEASRLGGLYFRAKAVWARKAAEAQQRWPEDLSHPCVGDAGALGELALLGKGEE